MDAAKHYRDRMQIFAAESVSPGAIVMVGSSHVERFDAARLLPGRRVVNRGIACDRIGLTDRGILHRLNESVFGLSPSAIVLENGGNDLGELWRHGVPSVEDTAKCYEQVVATIRHRLAAVPLCLVSVMPTTGEYAGLSPLVPPLNEHIMRIASQYACDYMNVYRQLVDDRGEIHAEFTDDGLHLTETAYQIWANMIEEWLPGILPLGPGS